MNIYTVAAVVMIVSIVMGLFILFAILVEAFWNSQKDSGDKRILK